MISASRNHDRQAGKKNRLSENFRDRPLQSPLYLLYAGEGREAGGTLPASSGRGNPQDCVRDGGAGDPQDQAHRRGTTPLLPASGADR